MSISLPTLISEGFGTGDSSKTNPIPTASQITVTPGAASFADGFPPLTRTALGAGGIPPSGEDMNGILYMVTQLLAFICSGQPFPWSSAQESAIGGYGVGAYVENSTGDGFWLNTTNNNATNPDAGGAGWVPGWNYGITAVSIAGGTTALTLTQVSKGIIAVSGTLTSNALLTMPAGIEGEWVVANNTAGAFTLGMFTVGGSNVVSIPQAGPNAPTIVYSNGTDTFNANVSTAGLAPINSPNFSGTPLTPTAPANSNTTQVASTAFTQAAITAAVTGLAPLASPTLLGNPTAPTQAPGTNNATLATTAFVTAAIVAAAPATKVKGGQTGTVSGAGIRVNFPAAFPNSILSVVLTVFGTSATYALTAKDTAGFNFNSGAATAYDWVAVGT